MAINYVKFQRGSQAAYDALKAAGKLDNDTLYFIYPEDNKSVGALYMGTRVISGGDITIASATLDDLADVIVKGASTDSFLVKGADGNWIAKSLSDVTALIKENLGDVAGASQVFQGTLNSDEAADAAIARIVGDKTLNSGDIVVLKKLINGDKYEYTAYVYTGTAWAAMDGNYNAKNVYFDSDLILTADVGAQVIPASGSKTLDTTGKNVKQVFDMLFTARKLPTKVEPTIILTSDESKTYEVGTSVAPSYSAILDAGSYSYGPATGITATSWSVQLGDQTLDNATGTFNAIAIDDNTDLTITATASYGEGAVPVDNLGEALTDSGELASCRIAAGSVTGTGTTIKGYRNAFYGAKVAPIEMTSDAIRDLDKIISTSNSFSITIPDRTKQVIIAVPQGRIVKTVSDVNAFGIDVSSGFTKSTVSVGGADATAEDIGTHTKDYNVYVYAPATQLSANTYKVTLANE